MNPPPADGLASRLLLAPALRAQSDRRLVTLVRDGHEPAFEEIVRRYGKALLRYAAAIVGGHSDDVVQDSLSKALQALRRNPEAEIELRPWLYRIVRNTALNDLRDRPAQAEQLLEAVHAGARSAADEAERRAELADLVGRLHSLPEAQRTAIVMRELEGLGHDEIAAALGISGGAARQAIHRARTALRDGLGMLMPLPLLRALADHGEGAAAGAGAGGASIASGAGALKLGVAAALIAGSVGTGIAIEAHGGIGGRIAAAAPTGLRRPRPALEGRPSPTTRARAVLSAPGARQARPGPADIPRAAAPAIAGTRSAAPGSRHEGTAVTGGDGTAPGPAGGPVQVGPGGGGPTGGHAGEGGGQSGGTVREEGATGGGPGAPADERSASGDEQLPSGEPGDSAASGTSADGGGDPTEATAGEAPQSSSGDESSGSDSSSAGAFSEPEDGGSTTSALEGVSEAAL